MSTAAEGLATRVGFELPQSILWEYLDDFVLVGEDELREAARLMIEHTRNLVETAGAAPLAAALRLRERLAGRRVALICTGGNVTLDQLRDVVGRDAAFNSSITALA
jgi:threonine dehydratase